MEIRSVSRLLERFSIATLGLTDHRKFDAATSGMNFAQSQIWIRLGGFLGILLTTFNNEKLFVFEKFFHRTAP